MTDRSVRRNLDRRFGSRLNASAVRRQYGIPVGGNQRPFGRQSKVAVAREEIAGWTFHREKAAPVNCQVERITGGPQDTLIQALIEKLPPAGPWSADERVNWLKLLTMAFQIAYGQVEEIEIMKPA